MLTLVLWLVMVEWVFAEQQCYADIGLWLVMVEWLFVKGCLLNSMLTALEQMVVC